MKTFAFGLMLSIVAACGGSSSANNCDNASLTANCNSTGSGECTDYTGLSTSDNTSASNSCFNAHNSFNSGTCTTAGRVGSCLIPASASGAGLTCATAATTVTVRFFAPFTTATAQSTCGSFPGGQFTAN